MARRSALGYRYEHWWSGRFRFAALRHARLARREAQQLLLRRAGLRARLPGFNLELGAIAAYRLSRSWQLLGGARPHPLVERRERQPGGGQRHAAARHGGAALQLQARPGERMGPPAAHPALRLRPVDRLRPDADPRRLHQTQHPGRHQHRAARRRPGPRASGSTAGRSTSPASSAWSSTRSAACRKTSGRSTPTSSRTTTSARGGATRLRTRFGFGAGISYASRIPFGEQRDQDAARARHLEAAALPRSDHRHQHRRPVQGARAARDLRRHRRLAPLGRLRLRAPLQQRRTAARTTSTLFVETGF